MNWINLVREDQLTQIIELSATQPQIIFKHSTRCSISDVAKNRLEKSTVPQGIDFYYLDLLNYRNISNKIAEVFSVYHESPQILLIKNGQCVYDESHGGIRMEDILQVANRN
ncbi:MAG: bacillithiol system redox-active protein YtxJ [Chitinophagaceae bacterium]|nr:bacillithiol system redox-active protein YtxJ [Chitinophagaceae bacterium]